MNDFLNNIPPKKLVAGSILFLAWLALTVFCWPIGLGLLILVAIIWALWALSEH